MTTKQKIAHYLKHYRKEAGYTVYEVGEKIGKSGKTVSAWENSKGSPDADILLQLCKLYGVESVAVFYGQPSIATSDMLLTPDEEQMLDLYRGATMEGQQAATVLLKGYARNPRNEKSASAI